MEICTFIADFPFLMDYLIICLAALVGSALTLFSGFGLGTILMPVFGIFFEIEIAIALTAIVHFLNNIFKLFLLGKHADLNIVVRFGIPSVIAALAGAYLLNIMSKTEPLYVYHIGNSLCEVTTIKLCIGAILLFFALFDIIPRLASLQFPVRYMVLGGLLSGFIGGISGNQGALRSAFLIRANLAKEVFIATGVFIACCIDITRLAVYSGSICRHKEAINYPLMTCATLAAFLGAFAGNKFLKKITIKTLQYFVAFALIVFSVLLAAGII